MEGAEHFDFFRQPDFVKDPFLKGSYAVYKKETLMGEGTGKLCHIHRPEIIDSRGRRCWGDLSVAGNTLSIVIPENWLSEAKYPVIVDPYFGTDTVGSQTHWENFFTGSYEKLVLESSVGLNRHSIFEPLTGIVTAYVYAYDSESEGRCKPVLYSNDLATYMTRLSKAEGSFDITVNSGKPAGWRSATFQTKETIGELNWLWYGVFCDRFSPRFDFTTMCIVDQVGNDLPDTLTPLFYPYNFELSMYFAYAMRGVHTRVITQWAMPSETRKLTGKYQRSAAQTARGTTEINRIGDFCRSMAQSVKTAMCLNRPLALIRKLAQQAGVGDKGRRFVSMLRKPAQTAGTGSGVQRIIQAKRAIEDTDTPEMAIGRKQDFQRDIAHRGDMQGAALRNMGYVKQVHDTAKSKGVALRHLFIFLRLLTGAHIREYIIGRFLKSKEELSIKSPVCREIIIDSKLH
jgi:hypothetical protein